MKYKKCNIRSVKYIFNVLYSISHFFFFFLGRNSVFVRQKRRLQQREILMRLIFLSYVVGVTVDPNFEGWFLWGFTRLGHLGFHQIQALGVLPGSGTFSVFSDGMFHISTMDYFQFSRRI